MMLDVQILKKPLSLEYFHGLVREYHVQEA